MKIKLPKTMMIKGEKWRLYYRHNLVDDRGAAVAGLACFPTRKIYIDMSLDPRDILSTFLHEFFHACTLENGGLDQSMTEDHEHFLIESICPAMSKNPELWSNIFKSFIK
jgi:hypothetical protein